MGSQPNQDANAAIRDAAVELLLQGEALLNAVDDDQYAGIIEPAFRASVGAHYRHCLEHFQLLLAGASLGEVDYDGRQRDRLIETDRFAAMNLTSDLIVLIKKLGDAAFDGAMIAVSRAGYTDEASPRLSSSFAREMVYAISHGVHHYALIAVMARLAGIGLPENFGVAPSTVACQLAKGRNEAAGVPLNAVAS